MQVQFFNAPNSVERGSNQPQALEWENLDAGKKHDYLQAASTSGSGVLTRLVFNTVDDLKAIFVRTDWIDPRHKEQDFPKFLKRQMIIQTLAFKTNLDVNTPPTDVVQLIGFNPGEKGKEVIFGTVPAEKFRQEFAQLFLEK